MSWRANRPRLSSWLCTISRGLPVCMSSDAGFWQRFPGSRAHHLAFNAARLTFRRLGWLLRVQGGRDQPPSKYGFPACALVRNQLPSFSVIGATSAGITLSCAVYVAALADGDGFALVFVRFQKLRVLIRAAIHLFEGEKLVASRGNTLMLKWPY